MVYWYAHGTGVLLCTYYARDVFRDTVQLPQLAMSPLYSNWSTFPRISFFLFCINWLRRHRNLELWYNREYSSSAAKLFYREHFSNTGTVVYTRVVLNVFVDIYFFVFLVFFGKEKTTNPTYRTGTSTVLQCTAYCKKQNNLNISHFKQITSYIN